MHLKHIALSLALGGLLAGCGTSSLKGDSSLRLPGRAQEAKNAARIHTQLAQHYMQLGDFQTALQKLKMALQFDDHYAPAYTVLAVVYEHIHQLSHALDSYQKAQQLKPGEGATNNNLGSFLCRTGKPRLALKYFKQAHADPFYATADVAWSNEGLCRISIHDYHGAKRSFQHALAINPVNAEALYQLARIMYLENRLTRARTFLHRYEALRKHSAAAHALEKKINHKLMHQKVIRHHRKHR